jgi:hypothetical protein
MKQLLNAVHASTPELRSMAVDIDKFVQALRALPGSLKADLLDPLKHYSNAAAQVASGSDMLEKVAIHLESVTNKLNGRLP